MTTEQEITGALARGFCHKKNENKEMDSDLVFAMVTEVMLIIKSLESKLSTLLKVAEGMEKALVFQRDVWQTLSGNVEVIYQQREEALKDVFKTLADFRALKEAK